jgi:hypothetical protein
MTSIVSTSRISITNPSPLANRIFAPCSHVKRGLAEASVKEALTEMKAAGVRVVTSGMVIDGFEKGQPVDER